MGHSVAAVEPRASAHAPVEQLHALTSLRFFAAMYVLLFHYVSSLTGTQTSLTRIGYTGVTFFFMLSGFILAHNYQRVDFSERISRHRYYVARLARIYPVFIVSLVLGLPFALAQLVKTPPGTLKALAASSALLAPLGLHAWVPGASCFINCPSWSISTEFFFYLLFPWLMLPIMRRPTPWLAATVLFWLAVCLVYMRAWTAVAPAGASIIADHDQAAPALLAQAIKFFPAGRLAEFMLGIILYAVWKRRRSHIDINLAMVTFVFAAAAVVACADRVPEVMLHNGLTAVAWIPLILAAANMRGGLLCAPTFIFLGRISFSLYLLHIPVLSAVLAFDKRVCGAWLAAHPSVAMMFITALALLAAFLVFTIAEEPSRGPIMRWLLDRWRLGGADATQVRESAASSAVPARGA